MKERINELFYSFIETKDGPVFLFLYFPASFFAAVFSGLEREKLPFLYITGVSSLLPAGLFLSGVFVISGDGRRG